MRRFEWIRGNEAKFWEIEHFEDVVITRSARLGKAAKDREKECLDDMAAEVEFDKQIHTKRRQGWVEVDAPSESPPTIKNRAMELRPLDGSKGKTFSGEVMAYVLWRLIETQILDRHRAEDDLSRWHYRAARQLGLDEAPTPDHAQHAAWTERMIELSKRDRAAPIQDARIAAFKWRTGSHWIVTPGECVILGRESCSRKPKRKVTTAEQEAWLQEWAAFHESVKAVGYEAIPG